MSTITVSKLEELLRQIGSRSMPVSFFAETVPDLVVRGNPFICPNCRRPALTKCARVNGFLGANYTRSVNRQRQRERPKYKNKPGIGYFKAMPRTWGDKDPGTPLILYRDNVYLNLKRENVLQVAYRLNGKIVGPGDPLFNEITTHLRKRTSEGSKRQHVFKQIVMRDYSLRSIRQITMSGKTYDVSRPPRRKAA